MLVARVVHTGRKKHLPLFWLAVLVGPSVWKGSERKARSSANKVTLKIGVVKVREQENGGMN